MELENGLTLGNTVAVQAHWVVDKSSPAMGMKKAAAEMRHRPAARS
jgi:hypothetical protein